MALVERDGSYGYREYDYARVAKDLGKLAGIIVRPASNKPCHAIVLVHGSGPADRDSRGGFVVLREHFTRNGYGVLCLRVSAKF